MKTQTLSAIKNTLDIKEHRYGRVFKATTQIGAWEVATAQSIDEDRNYYSKSWHRKYGAKFIVSGRSITFKRKWGKGFMVKTVPLNSWSGNYLENAIVAAGLAPKSPKTPLSVRLHKAFDAVLVRELRGHKIYQRTLLGCPVDFVIVAPMGTTFHSDQYGSLIRGLYAKIRAAAKVRFAGSWVDWKACKDLGFCDSGIKSFCEDFGLRTDERYTPDQIYAAVQNNRHKAAPYMAELKTLAAAYNYAI